MKKIIFINVVPNGSTGNICKKLYKAAEKNGFVCYFAFGRGEITQEYRSIKIGCKRDVIAHVAKSRIFDSCGFESKDATFKFLKKLDYIKPDIVHLHNLHGYYINIELLFKYFKTHKNIRVIWTLHDCWSFTGHCAHFQYENCKKWKTYCYDCPRTHLYPKAYIDRSTHNYYKKKELFYGLSNLELVVPSKWLANLVQQSFLNNYPIRIINNDIDTQIFYPTQSNILKKYNLNDKRIILGVASQWKQRKGLEFFIQLSKKLSQKYQIVLIGVSAKEKKNLPSNILGIERTENQKELAKWYSAAYVYLNPTLEDNYPTTNLEAASCGTPVLTFNTGGSFESTLGYGMIVNETLDENLLDSLENKSFKKKKMMDMRKKYLELYNEMFFLRFEN